MKQLYNSSFKLVNLLRNNLDQYLRIRAKLRFNYERLIVEEPLFSFSNAFDQKLWEECYEKPVGWIEIESHFLQEQKQSTLHLRSLRSLLISFLDEGSTLFQLLLRHLPDEKFSYNLSIYAAILLRKRENLNSISENINSCSRAFNLLQNAIIIEPFKGFGYFVMAQWTLKDNNPLLSIYWALTALNVKEPFPAASDFLKSVSRDISVSPSFLHNRDDLLNCQLLQMASHSLIGLITGSSHLKHLDQLSHSQVLSVADCDMKMLKYSCIIIWLIIGMFPNDQISPLQSCLLAKLFQVHSQFLLEPEIRKVFLAFSSNPKYYKLFSGKNLEIMKKINNFTFESFNNLLKKLLKIERKLLKLTSEIYLDFVIYGSDASDDDVNIDNTTPENPEASTVYNTSNSALDTDTIIVSASEAIHIGTQIDLISLFLRIELFSVSSDEINLKFHHEKVQRTERSVKLLTHQFLSTQIKTLESSLEPSHLPWTIPDYQSLLRHFPKIRKLITSRQCKIVITLPVLQELDFDKNRGGECRDIIRFLNELVETSDPSLRILEAQTSLTHVQSVKYFYENESKDVRIIISDETREKEYNFVQKTNLFKEIK